MGEHLFCKQEAAGSKPAGSIADSISVHLIYAGGSSFGRALIKADPVRDLYRNSSGLRSNRFESDPPAVGEIPHWDTDSNNHIAMRARDF